MFSTTKVQNISPNCTAPEKNVSEPLLDKSAQLAKIVLGKRARSKYISNALALKLGKLQTKLEQSYYNTWHCSEHLVQSGQKITSKYCNNRWCLTCNRIRTSKLIVGYKKPLSEISDPQLVTLTIPNVVGNVLRESIKGMLKTFRQIQKVMEKRKTPIVGIRKIEVTYNPKRGDFHPHFHLWVSGAQIGVDLVTEWLKRVPAANIAAQDVRPADEGSMMELFKYFSKIFVKKQAYVSALDVIFTAMQGMRVYQPMGIKKDVSEDVDEIRAEIYSDLEEREAMWSWIEGDWYDRETGEGMTGYRPSGNVNNLINGMK